jgi:CO dehydrogenase maturation factor
LGFNIAIAGKGGTGKTTLAALLIRYLLKQDLKPVLAVDADANANLNEALGVLVNKTVGSLREELIKDIDSGVIPAGVPKESYLEVKLEQALIEAEGFDLLVMGRPEGPGCYCYVNNLLRKYIDTLARSYPYVVIDNEAGMEHLSRRTTQNVDFLLLVADATPIGIETAGRIYDLAGELSLNIKSVGLVINKLSAPLSKVLERVVAARSLNLIGLVPEDEILYKFALAGRPLLEMSDQAPSVKAVENITEKIIRLITTKVVQGRSVK